MIDEPSNYAIHLRHVIRCGPFPTICPTLHLAFKKSFRLTEGNQTGPGNIDGVQAYQAIDKSLAGSLRIIRHLCLCQLWRNFIPQYKPVPPLHKEKYRTQHRWIFAQVKDVWSFPKMRMHHLKHAELTCHVVSFRGDWPKRAAPQDVLKPIVSVHPQQIGKVRVPAGKLFERDTSFSAWDSSAQPVGKRS